MSHVRDPRLVDAVFSRHQRRTAAVLFRDLPEPGTCWGWTALGPPRMHLAPLEAGHRDMRIWLEGPPGRRTFEPAPGFPAGLASAMQQRIERERERIEAAWTRHLLVKGWIRAIGDGDYAILVVYPGIDGSEFARVVDVGELIGCPQHLDHHVLGCDLVIGELVVSLDWPEPTRVRIPLAPLLWR